MSNHTQQSTKNDHGQRIGSDSCADTRKHRVQRITSEVLMSGQRELIIVHNDQEYRLRITSKDKLILTK